MKSALVALAAASVLVRTAAAVACGPTPPPFYVVEAQSPSADDAPLNTPIVVNVQEGQDGPTVVSFTPTLALTVQGDDQALELRAVGAEPTLTWVPVLSLEPNTTYEAHYNPGYEGIPDTIWQFSTGASATPALQLMGELSVTLEPGTDFVQECLSPCGGECVDKEPIAVTKARVKLPRARGGFAARWATLWLTDNEPYDFSPISKDDPDLNQNHLVSLSSYAPLDETDSGKLLITVPEEAEPYIPCFALSVTDARGDQALTEPLCLSEVFPPPATAVSPEPMTSEPNTAAARSPRTSSSCSFSAQGSSTGFSTLGLALGLAALQRRRKRG